MRIFLNALSIKTINTIVATRITRIRKIINPEIAPVLPSSKVVTKALGISATIPEKLLKKYHFLYLFVWFVRLTTSKRLCLQL